MLKVEGLFAGYGEQDVLHEVAFRIVANRFLRIARCQCAGKSTLINCIKSGQRCPAAADAFSSMAATSRTLMLQIVDLEVIQVPEGRLVFPQMTVLDNLRNGRRQPPRKVGRARRIEEAFELFPRLRERSQQLAGTRRAASSRCSQSAAAW